MFRQGLKKDKDMPMWETKERVPEGKGTPYYEKVGENYKRKCHDGPTDVYHTFGTLYVAMEDPDDLVNDVIKVLNGTRYVPFRAPLMHSPY